jgi:hypothetical protein
MYNTYTPKAKKVTDEIAWGCGNIKTGQVLDWWINAEGMFLP